MTIPGESKSTSLAPIAEFSNVLKEWDDRIVEVFAIAVLSNLRKDQIDLICRFDPEPEGDVVGYFWIANLIIRDEFEGTSKTLGLNKPFDLGMQIGNTIHLARGDTTKPGEYIQLWPEDERQI